MCLKNSALEEYGIIGEKTEICISLNALPLELVIFM
jgi:hypothetical protein